MLIVACQKCGETKVVTGSPDSNGRARAVWTCSKCGAGQIIDVAVSPNSRKGELCRIIGGLGVISDSKDKKKQIKIKGRVRPFENSDFCE